MTDSADDLFPLSFAQQRLWFLEQLEQPGAAYNVRLPLRLRGPLDRVRLQVALDALVARHESLRTRFVTIDDEPWQSVAPEGRIELEYFAIPDLIRGIRAQLGELCAHTFDLATGPLLRACLLRISDEEHVLLLLTHHIISDAWSSGVLFRDLAALYDGASLAELPVQYADYVVWQRDWLRGEELERQLGYWREHLAGAPAVTALPLDRPRPARQSWRGSRSSRPLPPALATALKQVAISERVSLFMLLLAAFKALLYRYGSGDDLVIGTPIAGRRRSELESVVGLFANTLALRTRLAGNSEFRTLLSSVRQTVLSAWEHQELPFEKLVEALQPVRELSHSPVFQVMFIQQNTPWEAAPMRELAVEPAEMAPARTAKFELTVSASEYQGELWLAFEYNSDLFDAATIDQLALSYELLLQAIAGNPAARIDTLPVLDAAMRKRITEEWNATALPLPAEGLPALLAASLTARGEETVAEFAGEALSAATLLARADALATRLVAAGARPGTVVAICLPRGLPMLWSLLGVMRSGAAWLPLDPALPPQRL